MKRFTLLLLLIVINATARAQNGSEYHQFSIGTGLGATVAYGNTDTKVVKAAYNFNINYNATPFVTYTFETQFGQLAGGSPYDYYQRQFTNTYLAMMAHADVQLGELINYEYDEVSNAAKNIYVGTGIGFMANAITYIQTTIPPNLVGNGIKVYPFLPASVNVVVPLRTGYEFKLFNDYDMPRYRLDLGFSFNTVFGRGLDGYATLSSIKFYSYFSATFKIGLGTTTIYRKPVPYYGY